MKWMSRCWKNGSLRFTEDTQRGLLRAASYQVIRFPTSWCGHFTERRTFRSSVSVFRSFTFFIVVWLNVYLRPWRVLGWSWSLSLSAGGGSSGGGGWVV